MLCCNWKNKKSFILKQLHVIYTSLHKKGIYLLPTRLAGKFWKTVRPAISTNK